MAILSFPQNPAGLSRRALQSSDKSDSAGPLGQSCGSKTSVRAITLMLLHAALLSAVPRLLAQAPSGTSSQPTTVPSLGSPPPEAAATDQKLFSRPVSPAFWTVTFKYGTVVTPQQAAHRPNMVKVTVLGKEALETIHYPERTAEVWRADGHVFTSEVGSEQASIRVGHGNGDLAGLGVNSDQIRDLSRSKNGNFTAIVDGVMITGNLAAEEPDWAEFKEFDWVTPELLKGKIEISGEKLLVYAELEPESQTKAATAAGKGGKTPAPAQAAQKYPAGPLGGLPLKPGIRVAAIEENTKIPRYLQLGENIQIYAFSKPQQAKLELPPKISALVAKPEPPPEGAKPVSLIP